MQPFQVSRRYEWVQSLMTFLAGGSVFCGIGGLFSYHLPCDVKSVLDYGVWEIFFSIFGLAYAIIVGLLIIEAHRRLRELSFLIQSESNSVDDIIDFLYYFRNHKQEDAIRRIKQRLLSFAKSLETDIKLFKTKKRQYVWRDTISSIIDDVVNLESDSNKDKELIMLPASDGLLRRVADLTTFRMEIIRVGRQGFPCPFYWLLGTMLLVVIVGFSFVDVANRAAHAWLTVVVTFIMWSLTYLIWDLDHPRKDLWNIHDDLEGYIEDLAKRIES